MRNLRIFLSLLLVFSFGSLYSQIQRPVKWAYSIEQKGSAATLVLKAKIDKGWHLYAQDIPAGGPIPTTFKFTPDKNYSLDGKTTEPFAEEVYDVNFDMKVKYYGEEAIFRQKIKLNSKSAFDVKGSLEFMVCNDQMCLPPEEIEFSIPVKGDAKASETTGETPKPSAKDSSLVADTATTLPVTVDTTLQNNVGTPPSTPGKINEPSADIAVLEPGCGDGTKEEASDKSFWGIFIAGMIGGLLALLTPCVFPMIPLTVSFFTKRSPTKSKGIANAIIYAVSIILIYVLLGFLVTVTLGSDALNAMASNVVFNMLFFVIFFIFALSFFGAFEITLPSSWVNKADQASDKGGLIGIFFMAFTLSLVSFSCTGPIIGTLLVEAARGSSYLGPIMGMTGFALALALPFGLFAAFPGWLNSLPKSGGWLNSVKVVLGFLELALALKFLSNVDLAYHWGLLKREVFIAIWIAIFGLMSLYLMGKIKFSHDSDMPYLGTGRLIFAILTLTFTIYLIPGLWGAPLRIISGFPPPEFYKEWIAHSDGAGSHSGSCPHNLNCYHDYESGMAYAKQTGKPVMIDFTGWSCVNCRKMEDNVWSQPQILKILSDDYVLISLYVDDKTPLPENEQYTSEFSGKKIKSTGNKWSDLQSRIYQTNSQPYYVLLDHQGKLLALPKGYTPDADQYKKFLEEGVCRFKNRVN
ncbi:MAG: thioredoxin family protein [Bacteroidetes bacterium]|nr:thioredoxin family protein [Bacteroidota bacterium]